MEAKEFLLKVIKLCNSRRDCSNCPISDRSGKYWTECMYDLTNYMTDDYVNKPNIDYVIDVVENWKEDAE